MFYDISRQSYTQSHTRTHKFAKRLSKKFVLKPIFNKQKWKPEEKTSAAETTIKLKR